MSIPHHVHPAVRKRISSQWRRPWTHVVEYLLLFWHITEVCYGGLLVRNTLYVPILPKYLNHWVSQSQWLANEFLVVTTNNWTEVTNSNTITTSTTTTSTRLVIVVVLLLSY